MRVLNKIYLGLLLVSISLIFYFCLTTFFPLNRKSVFETNKKYFDEVYSEYKKISQSKNILLTEDQFSKIFHSFYLVSQLDFSDYGDMLIYILEKNPKLFYKFALHPVQNIVDRIFWLFGLDENILNQYLSPRDQKPQDIKIPNSSIVKLQIRILATSIRGSHTFLDQDISNSIKQFDEVRNDIKKFFKSTSLVNQNLQRLIHFFNISITSEDIIIHEIPIKMAPIALYVMDFFKLYWSKKLSAEMMDSIFKFDLETSGDVLSYFYVSLCSLVFTIPRKYTIKINILF